MFTIPWNVTIDKVTEHWGANHFLQAKDYGDLEKQEMGQTA
jgi:hypothetical protein